MKLAYSSLACPGWTVEEAADAVARYHYDGIEWRLADGEPISRTTPDAVVQRVIAATRSRGLSVVALDTSCQLTQVEAYAQDDNVREAEFMVDLALELGTRTVRVFGGPVPDGAPESEAFASAVETLRRCVAYAAARGVVLLVETHDPLWSRSAKTAALVDAIVSPSVAVLYDVLHPCRMGEAPEQTLAALDSRIRLVHIKDGRRPPDGSEDWPLCGIGEGDVPLKAIADGLRARHYDGWFTFEWEKRWHAELAEPEVALPAGRAAIRALGFEAETAR